MFAPVFMLEAAPPPIPISMPGPPSCISSASGWISSLRDWLAVMAPTPPASMIGL